MKKSLRVLILGLLFMLAFVGGSRNIYASDSSVTMIDGASIRVATDESGQGLRFTAKLTGESIEHGFYLVYGKATLEDLQRVIKDKTLELNGKQVFKVVVPGVDKDGNFSVVLTGIPEEGYLSLISVFAYVDGVVAKENTNRSIAEVAIAAKQHGEVADVFDEIAQTVGNKVLFSSEDIDVPAVEKDENFELPVLEKEDYEFLGWSTIKGGDAIDELPSSNEPIVLYPIWEANFNIFEKEDSLLYLEYLFDNPSFDFLKEGMLKVETEIFINNKHIYHERDHGMVYDFEMLLDLDQDLELQEFYLGGILDGSENAIIYGDGTYLYRHSEFDGRKFDEMLVFSLNSQALNMFVPVVTEQELFNVFPASPRALNDVILDIEKNFLSYFEELELINRTKMKIYDDKTILTISLDGDFIVELLQKYWPYKNYQYRDTRNLNVDIILNLENDKFKRLDIEIKGLLHDYGMISVYYVDEEIVVPKAFDVYNKNKDYFEYTLYIGEEVHTFKVEEAIIDAILGDYWWSNDRYYDWDEFGYGEVIHKPYLFGFDTVGLYKDSEYNEPFMIYDFYDYDDYEVDIYVKTEESLPSIEELVDSYFVDGLAVLNYKTYLGDDAVYFETDKYAGIEVDRGYYYYYIHNKETDKYYYVYDNDDSDNYRYEAYEVFDRPEDLIIFKEVLKYDNNYKIYNGYFVPEERLIIRRNMLLFWDKKISNVRDEYQESTEEGINHWFDLLLLTLYNDDLMSIKLDYVDYIDINDLSNLTVTIRFLISKFENLNLLELVDKGLMTYNYTLNEEQKKIAFTIKYLDETDTFNTNYYDSSKGAYFVPCGLGYHFEDGFYYRDIVELPEQKHGNPVMEFVGYMAAANAPLLTEKSDLLPYVRTRNIVELYPVEDVYEYDDFIKFTKDKYIDIDEETYYDVANRTFYINLYEAKFAAVFTDDDITFYNDYMKIVFEGDELNDYQIDTLVNMFLITPSYRYIIEKLIIVEKLFSGKLEYLEFKATEFTYLNGMKTSRDASYVFSEDVIIEIDSFPGKLVVTYPNWGYFRMGTTNYFINPFSEKDYSKNYEIKTPLDESFKVSLSDGKELENVLTEGYLDNILEGYYIVVDDVVDLDSPYDDEFYNDGIVLYANYNHISNYLDILDTLAKTDEYELATDNNIIMRVSNNSQIDIYRYDKTVIYYEQEFKIRYSIDLTSEEERIIYYGYDENTYQLHEDFEVFNICDFLKNVSKDDFIYSDGELLYVGPYDKGLGRFEINYKTNKMKITSHNIDSIGIRYDLKTDSESFNYKSLVNIDINFNDDEIYYVEADLETCDNYIIIDQYDDLRITITFESNKKVYYYYTDLYEQGKAYIGEEYGDYYIYLVGIFDDMKIPLYYNFFDLSIDKVVIADWNMFYLNESMYRLYGEYETEFGHIITIAEELLYLVEEYEEYQNAQIIRLMPLGGPTVD